MNTALYCTSTAPTDTYYTHTNLGKAGELRPSLRPRSAAGRRPSKVKDGPRSALWPGAAVRSGDGDRFRRGLLTHNGNARAIAAALAKKPRPRPGTARTTRDRGFAPGWGPVTRASWDQARAPRASAARSRGTPPGWGLGAVALATARPRTAPHPRLHSCAGSVEWTHPHPRPPHEAALGVRADLLALSKAVAGPDWRAGPESPPARREFPDTYFETHGGARPQSLEIGRPRSAPPRRYRPSPTDA